MRQVPKPYKITSLREHLNSRESVQKHNRLNYENFDIFMQMVPEDRLGATALAKAFGVSTDTIYSWIKIYEKEQANG